MRRCACFIEHCAGPEVTQPFCCPYHHLRYVRRGKLVYSSQFRLQAENEMILTINMGSSTVKCAGYSVDGTFAQILKEKVEGRGEGLIQSLKREIGDRKELVIGHREVHPELKLQDH